jgi:phenylacetate-CoA ligase
MNISGVKVYPTAVKEVIETFSPEITGRMQIILDRPLPRVVPPVNVTVEAASSLAAADWERLAERIEAKVHLLLKIRTKIKMVPAGSIETSNLKTKLVHVLPANEGK